MASEPEGLGPIGRFVLAFIGLGVAFLGFSLVLSVFLSPLGLPLFIIGLGIAQAQTR